MKSMRWNVLYFTGWSDILAGKDAAILPISNLAVRVTIAAAIFVENGLGFRGEAGDSSPYNLSVRYLVNEKQKQVPGSQEHSGSGSMATLIKKTLYCTFHPTFLIPHRRPQTNYMECGTVCRTVLRRRAEYGLQPHARRRSNQPERRLCSNLYRVFVSWSRYTP